MSYFLVSFFFNIYNNYILYITNYNNNVIAHVHRVTYRGEVPSAHRELVQSTAATSRPTTPRPIRRRVARRRDPSHLRRVEWLSGPGFSREGIVAITERYVVVAEWLSTRALQTVVLDNTS